VFSFLCSHPIESQRGPSPRIISSPSAARQFISRNSGRFLGQQKHEVVQPSPKKIWTGREKVTQEAFSYSFSASAGYDENVHSSSSAEKCEIRLEVALVCSAE
jgi:hypothetical protein